MADDDVIGRPADGTALDAAVIDAVEAPADPTFVSDERQMLVEFLDYYRAVLVRKAAGLTQTQLSARLEPSTLTIGGLIKHMALVEQQWFRECWLGESATEPWASVDWTATPDWELESAADDPPHELARLYDEAIDRSRTAIEGAHDLAATVAWRDRVISLRWILIHMIEEYARHCGHADLLRESVDGQIGD